MKRVKVTVACQQCQKKKVKCTGAPACKRCQDYQLECIFTSTPRKRGPHRAHQDIVHTKERRIEMLLELERPNLDPVTRERLKQKMMAADVEHAPGDWLESDPIHAQRRMRETSRFVRHLQASPYPQSAYIPPFAPLSDNPARPQVTCLPPIQELDIGSREDFSWTPRAVRPAGPNLYDSQSLHNPTLNDVNSPGSLDDDCGGTSHPPPYTRYPHRTTAIEPMVSYLGRSQTPVTLDAATHAPHFPKTMDTNPSEFYFANLHPWLPILTPATAHDHVLMETLCREALQATSYSENAVLKTPSQPIDAKSTLEGLQACLIRSWRYFILGNKEFAFETVCKVLRGAVNNRNHRKRQSTTLHDLRQEEEERRIIWISVTIITLASSWTARNLLVHEELITVPYPTMADETSETMRNDFHALFDLGKIIRSRFASNVVERRSALNSYMQQLQRGYAPRTPVSSVRALIRDVALQYATLTVTEGITSPSNDAWTTSVVAGKLVQICEHLVEGYPGSVVGLSYLMGVLRALFGECQCLRRVTREDGRLANEAVGKVIGKVFMVLYRTDPAAIRIIDDAAVAFWLEFCNKCGYTVGRDNPESSSSMIKASAPGQDIARYFAQIYYNQPCYWHAKTNVTAFYRIPTRSSLAHCARYQFDHGQATRHDSTFDGIHSDPFKNVRMSPYPMDHGTASRPHGLT